MLLTVFKYLSLVLIVVLTTLLTESGSNFEAIQVGVLLVLLFLLSAIFLNLRRDDDIFHPGVAFPLTYLLLYGMGSIYLYSRGDFLAINVLFLSVLGIGCYQLGVRIGLGRRKYRIGEHSIYLKCSRQVLKLCICLIVLISLSSAAYIFARIGIPIFADDIFFMRYEQFSSVTHYSFYLMRSIGLAFQFFFIYQCCASLNKTRPRDAFMSRKLLLTLFAIAVLVLLSTAGRADIMFILILTVINYHYIVRPISMKKAVLFSCTAVLLITVISLFRLFRFSGQHETLLYLAGEYDSDIAIFFGHLFAQVSLAGVTFRDVLYNVPYSVPHMNGLLIPTTLATYLPGHQPPPGEILKTASNIQFTGGQANLTLLGDFYMDFGVLGIAVGMLALGYGIARLYRSVIENQSAGSMMLYTYAVYSLIVGIPGGLFSQAIRYYYFAIIVLVIVVCKIAIRRPTKKTETLHRLGSPRVLPYA